MAENDKPSLVALARRREQTTELLSQRFAEGVLELEEFEIRVERVEQANDLATLADLVSDLEPAFGDEAAESGSQALAVPEEKALARPVDQSLIAARPKSKRMVAIMGGVDRKGQWLVPEKIKTWALMGGITLDFREAQLAPGITDIRVRSLMGGVDIIVPPGVMVESDGIAIMGAFEDMHSVPEVVDEHTPRLRISGFAVMGAVDIQTRLLGESGWQARRRLKRERKRKLKLERARHKKGLDSGAKGQKQLSDGGRSSSKRSSDKK